MSDAHHDKSHEPSMIAQPPVGAYLCESTARNADYWLKEARHPDVERSSGMMFAEQAINAWKNLAYDLARQAHYYLMSQPQYALSHVAQKPEVQHCEKCGLRWPRLCEHGLCPMKEPIIKFAPGTQIVGTEITALSTTPQKEIPAGYVEECEAVIQHLSGLLHDVRYDRNGWRERVLDFSNNGVNETALSARGWIEMPYNETEWSKAPKDGDSFFSWSFEGVEITAMSHGKLWRIALPLPVRAADGGKA